ncbi:hypothetical protein [Nostoc sp. FACHB-888]|uniref:hypothetical protein n=1 Tax=Nostoc sp. FACHB-888 TaxID=2692842 RepID=UPI00168379CB|nr:hypothetical protein [Nostoc sp. FACHB-888]MBD2248378.1 hypothetical protein [Nostoc sp. FACHB-888]
MILPQCGRDGLRPAGGDRSSNNVAIARRGGKTCERFMDGCLERGKAPNRNCRTFLFIVGLYYLLLNFFIPLHQ